MAAGKITLAYAGVVGYGYAFGVGLEYAVGAGVFWAAALPFACAWDFRDVRFFSSEEEDDEVEGKNQYESFFTPIKKLIADLFS